MITNQNRLNAIEKIMDILEVFKESIKGTNKDKEYWLLKFKEMTELAESISTNLQDLTDTLDNDKYSKEKSSENKAQITHVIVTEEELAVEILNFEILLEEARRNKLEYSEIFENYDQKANQLFNILSTVLKSIKEMNASITRNIN